MRLLATILLLVAPTFALRQLCEHSAPGEVCFHFVPRFATFNNAENTCRQLGGQLASILNPHENQIIAHRAYGLAHSIIQTNVFWVGGYFANWRWNWVDGFVSNYHNFATVQDLSHPNWPCLSIIATNGWNFNGLWLPTFCNGLAPFVCEVIKGPLVPQLTTTQAPGTTTTQAPRPTPQIPGNCSSHLSPCFNNHIYVIDRIARDWDHAQEYCRQRGGNLVSILNKVETDFVASIASEANLGFNIWIGGFVTKSRNFVWNDGSKWEYTNFYDDQPNQLPQNNCLEIFDANYKKWVNYDCKREYPSICKVRI